MSKRIMPIIIILLMTLFLPSIGKTMELPEVIHQKIKILSQEGNLHAEKKKYREATKKFIEALELLPKPINQWEACTWLLVAIGDMNFLQGSFKYSKKALSDAMTCPNAIGNPFIHLRLGQSYFELGNKSKAADELTRAYMGAGKKIFASEDPKYFEFLKTVLKPPAGGKW